MANSLHLAIAGFVFVMVLIGIIITILEFRRMIRTTENRANRDPAATRSGAVTEARSHGAAGGD